MDISVAMGVMGVLSTIVITLFGLWRKSGIKIKDLSVKRKDRGEHLITLGLTFIHTNSSARTYCSFVHDIADNLSEEIRNKVIGSDKEIAFTVAIRR